MPLPMFPLGCVLFPGMGLPLHVFEPRYRVLVNDCLAGIPEFGVVLIERGSEVGGGDRRFQVATVARIDESEALPDGRWVLLTTGSRRIRVETWLPDDPYPVALVQDMEDAAEAAVGADAAPDALFVAERAVRRALGLVAEASQGPTPPATFALHSDPGYAAWQLCALAPIGPIDHQRLLEAPTTLVRLSLLAELAGERAELLARRLSGE